VENAVLRSTCVTVSGVLGHLRRKLSSRLFLDGLSVCLSGLLLSVLTIAIAMGTVQAFYSYSEAMMGETR